MTLCRDGDEENSEYLNKNSMVLVGVGAGQVGRKMDSDCHGKALFKWKGFNSGPPQEFHPPFDHSGSGTSIITHSNSTASECQGR